MENILKEPKKLEATTTQKNNLKKKYKNKNYNEKKKKNKQKIERIKVVVNFWMKKEWTYSLMEKKKH